MKISDSVYRFGTWISNINIDYLYDSLGNISTEFENRFNTFTKTTYTYNEFQQQTSMLKQKIMNGNLINDKFYNYYYEQYNDGVGIKMDDIMESSIYPNPFRENVTIDFYLENSEKINLKINDINGRCIYHLSEFFPAGKQSVFWSPESLNTGLYIYTIKSVKSSAVGRLINF